MTNDEQEAIKELKRMSREELDLVDYDLKKWGCQCKGCTNGTKVRDYGIGPEYYLLLRGGSWVNLNLTYFICGKHNQFMKRLKKSFDDATIEQKLMDWKTMPEKKLVDIKFTKTNKIEKHAKPDKREFL